MWLWLRILTSLQEILLGFPPQLHMQSTSRWCLQVIFLWSAPLALPTMPRNWSALVNTGWWLAGVKKLNNEVVSHQRTQPFIIWCFARKTPFCTLFWKRTTWLAPSSGLVSRTSLLAMGFGRCAPCDWLAWRGRGRVAWHWSTESRRSPEVHRQNKWHLWPPLQIDQWRQERCLGDDHLKL